MPERGDVITYYSRGEAKDLVKRVIAISGENVSFSGGDVYINGEILEDPYCKEPHSTFCDRSFTVPSGCVFCLGDNREHSNDSRFLDEPYVSIEKIDSIYLGSIKVPEKIQSIF